MGNPFRFLVTACLVGCLWASSVSAADVFVGKRDSKRTSIENVDHAAWTRLLAKYVDSDGLVNYAAWKATPEDVRRLDAYLRLLSDADASAVASREAQLAFWINAYNAVTIHGILREYPTSSIRNHTARFFGYNIWKNLKLYVGGTPYSLDQIEHDILRTLSDPRVHFAIVCAANGCPRLLDEAYLADTVNEQLEDNAFDFFSRRQNFYHDAGRNRLYLSSILSWFGEDFGRRQRDQLATISKWLPTPEARRAARSAAARVSYLSYDWELNAQR